MASYKDRMILLSYFKKKYKKKFNERYVININSEQWSADALLESYGIYECQEIIDYYFQVRENPTWSHFAHNADKARKAMLEKEKDIQERLMRRKLAKDWLK